MDKPPIVPITSENTYIVATCQRDADYQWAITDYRAEVLKEVGEWLNGDCPHRTMANLDGEGDISLRHRSECPECLEALKSMPNKEGE